MVIVLQKRIYTSAAVYDFRMSVLRELITSSRSIENRPHHSQRRSSAEAEPLLRLVARHFPSFIPPTNKKVHPQRKCVVCKGNDVRKETIYWCELCKSPLCAVPCFADFHLKRHCSAVNTESDSE